MYITAFLKQEEIMRTLICILFILISGIISLLFSIKYAFLKKFSTQEKQIQYAYKSLQRLTKGLLFCAGTRLNVKGKENIPKNQTLLFICNHKSLFDIPILVSSIDIPMAFVGKIQLKKVPIISFWMKKINCIFMDRDDIRQSLKAINQGIEQLKNGQSLLIFPEGTRIKGEELGEFKKGSLKLANKSNVPIIPIYIKNADKILENQFPWIKATHIDVRIGKPIIIEKLDTNSQKNLSEYVKKQIEILKADI